MDVILNDTKNVVIKDFFSDDDLKRIKAIDILKKLSSKKVRKILFDTKNVKFISVDTLIWLREKWYVEANRVGITHMAFLIPEDSLGRILLEIANNEEKVLGKISIEYFDCTIEAIRWVNKN